jgi:hypothetical protein
MAKKISGKLQYFGPWADPEAALAKFQAASRIPASLKQPKSRSSKAGNQLISLLIRSYDMLNEARMGDLLRRDEPNRRSRVVQKLSLVEGPAPRFLHAVNNSRLDGCLRPVRTTGLPAFVSLPGQTTWSRRLCKPSFLHRLSQAARSREEEFEGCTGRP